MIRKVTFEEAKELLDADKNIKFLDVREEEEYFTGHAKGAELFALSEISEETAADMIGEKDTPVMVYCKSGKRSAEAAHMLESYGYGKIYDVGGLVGWPYGIC